MCLGSPGRVLEVTGGHGENLAVVDIEGVSRRVSLALLDEGAVVPGDWVLVHMGFALEQVTEATVAQARVDRDLLTRGADET